MAFDRPDPSHVRDQHARRVSWPAVMVTVAALALAAIVLPVRAATGGDPPPTTVILARSDNPADALAAGSVGGVLGAPVLLTPRDRLHEAAASALAAIGPDLVVIAGGPAALSHDVQAAVEDLGFATLRVFGDDRHETAAELSALLARFATGRPVLTGTPVTDAVIPGLNAERLQGLTPDDLQGSQGPPGPPGPKGDAATTHFAAVRDSGALVYGSGAIASARPVKGHYVISFDRDLAGCVAVGNAGFGSPTGGGSLGSRIVVTVQVGWPATDQLTVNTDNPSTDGLDNSNFLVAVFC